jgi:hypothetical protein
MSTELSSSSSSSSDEDSPGTSSAVAKALPRSASIGGRPTGAFFAIEMRAGARACACARARALALFTDRIFGSGFPVSVQYGLRRKILFPQKKGSSYL